MPEAAQVRILLSIHLLRPVKEKVPLTALVAVGKTRLAKPFQQKRERKPTVHLHRLYQEHERCLKALDYYFGLDKQISVSWKEPDQTLKTPLLFCRERSQQATK